MQIKGIHSNHFLRNEEINSQREFPVDVLTALFLMEVFRQKEKTIGFPTSIINYFGMVHKFHFNGPYLLIVHTPLRAGKSQRHHCTNRNFI